MTFQPYPLLFSKGLDLSGDPASGGDELDLATNVEFTRDGVIRGRPGRTNAQLFSLRIPGSDTYPAWQSPGSFESLGFFTPLALNNLRTKNGERPGYSTNGRLFTQDGTRWIDKGPQACFRVTRTIYSSSPNKRYACAQDFGHIDKFQGVDELNYALAAPSGDPDRVIHVDGADWISGNSARSGTTTATVVVNGNELLFVYRTNGADTLGNASLSLVARTPTDVGDSPSICCSADQTVFFVAFRTTTADQYKVLRVSLTGTILATFTSTFAGLYGIWVDNTRAVANTTVVALTGTNGLLVKVLNATAMTDISKDSTVVTTGGQDVVIGREVDARFWWAYRVPDLLTGTLKIGTVDPTTAASAITYGTFPGRVAAGSASATFGVPKWSICHQPVSVDNHTYLTLSADTGEGPGNWLTVDLTSWRNNVNSPGPFPFAFPVARGQTNANKFSQQPSSAAVLPDGTGWTFASMEFTRFNVINANVSGGTISIVQGTDETLGVNTVKLSQPRATQFGESTVFSGSVPFAVAGGRCAELGFPFLAGVPGLDGENAAGGTVTAGTYQVVACWAWKDEAGQIHRSAPSAQVPVVTSGGNLTIKAYVTNPWLHGKEFGRVRIELYVSASGGTTLYRQTVVDPDLTEGFTTITISAPPTVAGSEILYTTGGVFPNVHVPGDGGVAAVGRRLWMATGNEVWASKLRLDGTAPEFSDSAGAGGLPPLRVALPAGAGRVVALEAMDDKLLIFCERGIFAVQDGGPDNIGIGPDFGLERVSELGCAGPRATCPIDSGVAFFTPPNATNPYIGGPWVVDRGKGVVAIGRGIQGRLTRTYTLLGSLPVEVAFLPERQQLFVLTTGLVSSDSGIAVLDVRTQRWALWTAATAFGTLSASNGILWAAETGKGPRPFDRTDGTDNSDGNVTMTVVTSHRFASGKPGMGWARVRSVRPVTTADSGAHTLGLFATSDLWNTVSTSQSMSAGSSGSTWPSNRQAPEWRLPSQKCSTLQIKMTAVPAVAEWTGVELMVQPLPGTAPPQQRF